MLISCNEEFIKLMDKNGVIDEPLCIGFGMHVSDLEIGMQFIVLPTFAFPLSKDTWTLEDALKIHNGEWTYDKTGSVYNHYTDKFEILKIHKRFSKTVKSAFVRVRNIRTNVDFNIIENRLDEDEICDLSTFDLYFIQ